MANIEELQRALRQGSDAKARLAGLDEQYQQAQDRGVATTEERPSTGKYPRYRF